MHTHTTSLTALLFSASALQGCQTCEPQHRAKTLTAAPDAAPSDSPAPSPSSKSEPAVSVSEEPSEAGPVSSDIDGGNPMPAPSAEPATSEPPLSTPLPAPQVDELPVRVGAWGDVLLITGSALEGTAPQSAVIGVGEELRLQHDDDAVIEWNATTIQFRVPFPYQGDVFVETREGRVQAGSFESEWTLQEPLQDFTEQVITSLSPAPLSVILALAGNDLRLARFDQSGWRSLSVVSDGISIDSFNLYQQSDGAISAFAVSDTDPPQLMTFDGLDFTGQITQVVGKGTGHVLGARWIAAGSIDGGVVWSEGEQGWERLRATAEGWAWDKGPIVAPDLDQVTAGATSDGSLYFAYAVDTGNFLDDLGAPFYRRLATWQTEFAVDVRGGRSVDDYLTSLTFKSHGRGFLLQYCGTDTDPFNLSGNALRCYSAAHSIEGDAQLNGLDERDGARHAFTRDRVGVVSCNDADELRVSINRELDPGAVVTWPCADARRLEIDPLGAWLPVLSINGNFHVATSDRHSSVAPASTEAGAPSDAGQVSTADAAPHADAAIPGATLDGGS